MTMPTERYKSLMRTQKFLSELQNPKGGWKKISEIRKEAAICMKHYPWEMHLEDMANQSPDTLRKER